MRRKPAALRNIAIDCDPAPLARIDCDYPVEKVDRVHWPAYAGRNFTHRQSIKRKAQSWGRRYQAMPAGERLAVLSSMMAVEAGEVLE